MTESSKVESLVAPGAIVPIDAGTTHLLIRAVIRLNSELASEREVREQFARDAVAARNSEVRYEAEVQVLKSKLDWAEEERIEWVRRAEAAEARLSAYTSPFAEGEVEEAIKCVEGGSNCECANDCPILLARALRQTRAALVDMTKRRDDLQRGCNGLNAKYESMRLKSEKQKIGYIEHGRAEVKKALDIVNSFSDGDAAKNRFIVSIEKERDEARAALEVATRQAGVECEAKHEALSRLASAEKFIEIVRRWERGDTDGNRCLADLANALAAHDARNPKENPR